MSSAEDNFLACEEKLCRCLKEFRQASANLEKYINSTIVRESIDEIGTAMEKILHELEEVKK